MNRGRQNYLLTDGGWILVVKHNFHTTDVEGNGKRIYLQRKGVADGCAGEGLERGDQYWGINYTLPPPHEKTGTDRTNDASVAGGTEGPGGTFGACRDMGPGERMRGDGTGPNAGSTGSWTDTDTDLLTI